MRRLTVVGVIALACWLAACTAHTSGHPTSSPASTSSSTSSGPATGIHKIKHIIVIMQENRSFDSYFGTYPGADGIPMSNGVPTVCVPAGAGQPCQRPYADHANVNGGGPHGHPAAVADEDGGKMDGFVT